MHVRFCRNDKDCAFKCRHKSQAKTMRISDAFFFQSKIFSHKFRHALYHFFFYLVRYLVFLIVLIGAPIKSFLIEACLTVDLSNRMYQSSSNWRGRLSPLSFTYSYENTQKLFGIGHVNVTSISNTSIAFITLSFDYVPWHQHVSAMHSHTRTHTNALLKPLTGCERWSIIENLC